ncbi:hypothetical protein HNY73_011322 [Argiope bruennichi]|uniref:MULE transposase domain-containing protein n=1 Tax=Argiope bruennichi TaxID=94029 RepID=A0A8T0F8S0_ARGBR|nr:hypothetical protein HNY73_011322 [Argiope bruennichi]
MIANDYNPILVYKPMGESLSDFPQIGTEEILPDFATEAQMKLLELYGGKCIILDSTHGANQYGFQLTTILVNEDNHEGQPVATLFSTRVACETFEPFFKAIKLKLKEDFKTKLILTDDTNSFCNAWTSIFQNDAKHILCAWHLKYEETGETIMKRLDKSIHVVLKAVTKKLLERIISIQRGKLTDRVSLVRKRHLVAQNLDEKIYSVYKVKEHQWTVAKVEASSIFTYDINIEVNFFTKTDAASICSNADDVNEGELAIAINEHKELQSFGKSAIVNQLQRIDISAQKASLVLRLQNISNQIQALEALEDLNGAAELNKTLEIYLQTISSKRSLPSISDEVKNTPINKNMLVTKKILGFVQAITVPLIKIFPEDRGQREMSIIHIPS